MQCIGSDNGYLPPQKDLKKKKLDTRRKDKASQKEREREGE